MDAYRVSARIDGATPRRARRPAPGRDEALLDAAGVPIDLIGRPIEDVLDERWQAIRERWSQTTFFLFDAESWRS